MWYKKVFFIIFLILLAGCDFIWTAVDGRIEGQVLDTKKIPVPSARVSTNPSTKVVFTDDNGYFVINNVSEGTYNISVIKEGYISVNQTCTVDKRFFFSCTAEAVNIEIVLVYNQ